MSLYACVGAKVTSNHPKDFFFFFFWRHRKIIKDSEREYMKLDENLLGLGASVDSRHLPSTVLTCHIFPWK